MSEKVLGLDLGTNSIGWAVIERNENTCKLLYNGVEIFQEGVAREKGNEIPMVKARTDARALRRHYFHRRLRKIELLKVLVENNMCPPLTEEQIKAWKNQKIYPCVDDFIAWQRTNDNENNNPYRDRYIAINEVLDLSLQHDRYLLGRAFYHLAQRRGFLSNRKDMTNEDESGIVKSGISSLTEEMKNAGCRYIGEYFYKLYQSGEKIRGKYTSRNEHCRAEFNAICKRQNLSAELIEVLNRAIFFQRPLKSQKGIVGKCTFESKKSRCPISHPRYEEFRMLSFINNIKIKTLNENRRLNAQEIDSIIPLFLRKSKPQFKFEEIAKTIAGKKENYGYIDDKKDVAYRFNYKMDTVVSGCPMIAAFKSVWDNDWLDEICSCYIKGIGKSRNEIINDIWHVLFSFDSDDKLRSWLKTNLQLDEANADKLITIPQGYASLSLNAIDKILPFLRKGYRYDEAVFVANLKYLFCSDIVENTERYNELCRSVLRIVNDFEPIVIDGKRLNTGDRVKRYLRDVDGVIFSRIDKLYHPSMIEAYPKASQNENGELLLGSPRISSVRNPMAMRALFRLRALINTLLREGKIDPSTKINIEFARELNDANKRKAIEEYQREREAENKRYAEEIKKLYAKESGVDITPSDDDILKYRLWMEQKHICIYTQKTIGITEFLGANPKYDIEHTIPRSRYGDNSVANKTLCDCRFNREIKCAQLPTQLSNYPEIINCIESLGWYERIRDLSAQIERTKRSYSTKEAKDKAIQRRHKLKMHLDYWQSKLDRFTMKEIPTGFSNRQGADIGVIGRYARLYLNSVFDKIYVIKGATTAEFRKMWGIQDEYVKKERVNHSHHCIDAVVIACIGKSEYEKWAQYNVDVERYEWNHEHRPAFEKPWPTFTEDLKNLPQSLFVPHHHPDNMPKQTRKILRKRGVIQTNSNGHPIYQQGDSARCSLHLQTFYGAIKRNDKTKYVVRKPLNQLSGADVENIVDEAVKQKIRQAIDRKGFKEAITGDIWMNEEKRILIKKVRIYVPSVVSPINLKKHRDLSSKNYKQHYHVANDRNYCMAIYEGTDRNGKPKRSYEIVNNLEAAKYFKQSSRNELMPELLPLSDKDDYALKWVLKVGTMVLLYEKSADELKECNDSELVRRLYKVVGINTNPTGRGYGVIKLRYHQEARSSSEFKSKNGAWKINEELRCAITLLHTQFNAYVEGVDFDISITGKITFKH